MPDSGILTSASIFIIGLEEVVRFDGTVQALLSLKANSVLNGSINPLNTSVSGISPIQCGGMRI
jgi:hypothetical protein